MFVAYREPAGSAVVPLTTRDSAGRARAPRFHRRTVIMCGVIDTMPAAETAPRFLRRGAVVVVVLLALAGLAVFLTGRGDADAARGLCSDGARARFGAPVEIRSVDRTNDDTFLVHGATGTQAFACLVTREPFADRWELASVS